MDISISNSLNLEKIKTLFGENLESVILFGSYSILMHSKNSDIDLLIIVNKKNKIAYYEKEIKKINPKIDLLLFSKSEFKEKVLEFNHQLITLFYQGVILFDKNNFYRKQENLFLALNRKKDFTLNFRNKTFSLKKLIKIKGMA